MTALWSARTPREQVLLIALGLIGLGYVLIILIWQPLQQQRDQLITDIARYGRTATALQTLDPTALPARPLTADMPLPTLITTTADAAALPVSRLVPSDTAVEITLDSAPFANVLTWIASLEQDHGLRIQSLTFTRKPEPGTVSTTLTVAR